MLASPGGVFEFAAPEWEEHRAVLARVMDEAGWRNIVRAYAVTELVASGEGLIDDADHEMKRARAKLDGLLTWSRDVRGETKVLTAYHEHLSELVRRKRAVEAVRDHEKSAPHTGEGPQET
jgi:hypothetical protein